MQPRGVSLDHEQPRAEAAHFGRDDEELRLRRQRHERLLAVELPAAVVAHRARAWTHRVEERPRLEDRERRRHEAIAEERREKARLLRAGAPLDDRLHGRQRREDRRGQAHVAARELLGDEGVGHRGPLGRHAAELLRDRQPREAEGVALLQDLVGRRRRVVCRARRGPQRLVGEAAHRVAHERLVLGRASGRRARRPVDGARRFGSLEVLLRTNGDGGRDGARPRARRLEDHPARAGSRRWRRAARCDPPKRVSARSGAPAISWSDSPEDRLVISVPLLVCARPP